MFLILRVRRRRIDCLILCSNNTDGICMNTSQKVHSRRIMRANLSSSVDIISLFSHFHVVGPTSRVQWRDDRAYLQWCGRLRLRAKNVRIACHSLQPCARVSKLVVFFVWASEVLCEKYDRTCGREQSVRFPWQTRSVSLRQRVCCERNLTDNDWLPLDSRHWRLGQEGTGDLYLNQRRIRSQSPLHCSPFSNSEVRPGHGLNAKLALHSYLIMFYLPRNEIYTVWTVEKYKYSSYKLTIKHREEMRRHADIVRSSAIA